MQERPEIIYVTDPMCSWCWAFSPEINALRAQFEKEITFRVIAGVLRTGNAALSTQDAGRLGQYWHGVMDKTGQHFNPAFNPPEGFTYDTAPSCRAVITVRQHHPDKVFDYLKAVQSAFYVQHQDITSPEILANIAESVHIDRASFVAHYESEAMAAATWADRNERFDLGIDGFPALILRRNGQDKTLSYGYQGKGQIESVLVSMLNPV